jgi:hypothetical protein
MTHKICLFLLLWMTCSYTQAEVIIPLSIDKIETQRAKDNLVRVIQYNMAIKQEFRIEMIKPIEQTLLDLKNINRFKINKREFIFSESEAIFVNSTTIEENAVKVKFEYYIPKATPFIANCVIPILPSKFGKMACERENDE